MQLRVCSQNNSSGSWRCVSTGVSTILAAAEFDCGVYVIGNVEIAARHSLDIGTEYPDLPKTKLSTSDRSCTRSRWACASTRQQRQQKTRSESASRRWHYSIIQRAPAPRREKSDADWSQKSEFERNERKQNAERLRIKPDQRRWYVRWPELQFFIKNAAFKSSFLLTSLADGWLKHILHQSPAILSL